MNTEVKYELTITPEEGYTFYKVTGEWSPASRHEVFTKVAQLCLESDRPRAMIDLVDTHGITPPQDIYLEVQKFCKEGLKSVDKIAIVDSPTCGKAAKFRELVAQNRGLRMQVFFTAEEAKAWLV